MKADCATQRNHWLWLQDAVGHDVMLFDKVLHAFEDLGEAHALAEKGDTAAFSRWGDGAARKLCAAAMSGGWQRRLDWAEKSHTRILCRYEDEYPILLKEIRFPPSVLYVKGELEPMPKLPLGIVGMRKNTLYGEAVAKHMAKELVKQGATIISGMAKGIDSHAAAGALEDVEAKLPTVAVLGCGVDVIYPPSNARLYDEIVERGAVVSEFLPGTKPFPDHFPIRNRIISGLSRGVLVIEAAQRSGSSITANHALDQNRDLFAVPGRVTDAASFGPNRLIQRGEAKPVFCAADILCEYGIQEAKEASKMEPPAIDKSKLSLLENRIVEELLAGEKSADELCEALSCHIAVVNSSLTSLQFSGIIKQLPGRVFGL